MASDAIRLSAGSVDLPLQSCEFTYTQGTDPISRQTTTKIRGGVIHMTLRGTKDTQLLEWITNHKEHRDGSITFYAHSNNQKIKEIKFKKAFPVVFQESFVEAEENSLMIQFSITCDEVEVGNDSNINAWKNIG
jgi:hypothetical protein